MSWTVYIDAMVLNNSGNLYDAISIAAKAAIYDTKIPKINVLRIAKDKQNTSNERQYNYDIEVSDDPQQYDKLNVSRVPVCVTLSKIGGKFIVDANLDEEQCVHANLVVSVNSLGHVCSVEKGGKGTLDPSLMFQMIENSKSIALKIISSVNDILQKEENTSRQKVGFFGKNYF